MGKPVFLINPKSHRVKQRGSILSDIASAYDNIPVVYFDGQTPLNETLPSVLQQGTATLYLEGGDGTVVAALTTCFEAFSSGQKLPRFALLPGGSTNLAHAVLGLKRVDAVSLKQRLDQTAADVSDLEIVSHRALVVETSERKYPLVGFLLSTGSLARLMLYTQANLHGQRRGLVSIARAILQLILFPHSTRYSDDLPLLRPSHFLWDGEAVSARSTEQTFALFSTFRELSLGLSPFWGRGDAPIGFTHAAWPINRLRLGIVKAVLGKATSALEHHGLTSEGCSEMIFQTDGPVVLDGEDISIPTDRTFKVSVSPDLEFIR